MHPEREKKASVTYFSNHALFEYRTLEIYKQNEVKISHLDFC